jgi:hypothetical protein
LPFGGTGAEAAERTMRSSGWRLNTNDVTEQRNGLRERTIY